MGAAQVRLLQQLRTLQDAASRLLRHSAEPKKLYKPVAGSKPAELDDAQLPLTNN